MKVSEKNFSSNETTQNTKQMIAAISLQGRSVKPVNPKQSVFSIANLVRTLAMGVLLLTSVGGTETPKSLVERNIEVTRSFLSFRHNLFYAAPLERQCLNATTDRFSNGFISTLPDNTFTLQCPANDEASEGWYVGSVENNQRHGWGALYNLDGSGIYTKWKEGHVVDFPDLDSGQTGKCQVVFNNNHIPDSVVCDDGKTHFAYVTWPMHDEAYIGKFVDGEKRGQGKFYKNQIRRLDGIWMNNRLLNGTSYWQDGTIKYKGVYSVEGKQLDGTSFGRDGKKKYSGYWSDGKKKWGVSYRKNGKEKFNGWWNNGTKKRGTYYTKDGNVEYIGEKDNKIKNGQGKQFSSDGKQLVYDGDWERDLRNGKGTSYKNGVAEYKGSWENDKKKGDGKLFAADGKTLLYSGMWKDDKRHGYGQSYNEDGSTAYVGDWVDDHPETLLDTIKSWWA